jgi:hypothetical protein
MLLPLYNNTMNPCRRCPLAETVAAQSKINYDIEMWIGNEVVRMFDRLMLDSQQAQLDLARYEPNAEGPNWQIIYQQVNKDKQDMRLLRAGIQQDAVKADKRQTPLESLFGSGCPGPRTQRSGFLLRQKGVQCQNPGLIDWLARHSQATNQGGEY